MSEQTVGREPVQIIEIQQPMCAHVYGSSPCTAAGTDKCYNTRSTCQDAPNFTLGTPLSLFFSRGRFSEQEIIGAPYIIPSLKSVSTSPTKINVASASSDAKGLGNRAVCNISFNDHPHTDRLVDPYLSTRSFDPMERGSFWSKWIARNKYRQNVVIKVYECYSGADISMMMSRQYFLQSITHPDDSGNVKITGKDILVRIEERKAQAPALSPGKLYADINDSVTSIEVANAIEADYSAAGTIRISDELMTYSARATSANGITFTITSRASDNTIAEAHGVDDAVQECLRFTAERVDSVLDTILTTYGGVPAAYLDTANWTIEADSHLAASDLTTIITDPTSVFDLVSDIQEQTMCFVWWDERDAKVKLRAIRGVDVEPDILTAENNILKGSFSIAELPRQRTSQVWIHYNRNNYVKSKNEPTAYASQLVIADLESETDELYGEPSIRKVFADWLHTDALALSTASKIITRYVDIPRTCTFEMDAKDRQYWTGDNVRISHFLDVDQFGNRVIGQWAIISAEEVVAGERVKYVAEDTTLSGRITVIMANDAPDYVGDGSDAFNGSWIGDDLGLLSNGDPCARIN